MNDIVIAANNLEDGEWTRGIPERWRIHRNEFYRPAGRECYSYLDYIVSTGGPDNAHDDVVFCQGYPFDQAPRLLEEMGDPRIRAYGMVYECDPTGYPNEVGLHLHQWSRMLGLPVQEIYRFAGGAMYRVSGRQIRSRSMNFYRALFHLTTIASNRAAWALERLWPIIWGIDL